MTVDRTPPPPQSESDLVDRVAEMLRARLPEDWELKQFLNLDLNGRSTFDAAFAVSAPDGREIELVIEARRLLAVRDVPRIAEQLRVTGAGRVGLVAARYLAASVRKELSDAGLSFADATGNMLVRASSPALFISDRGADNDPWRGPGRPRGTLKGEPAAKVVRALVDFPGPWKVRNLIEKSKASTGSVYRVLDFLEEEALLQRDREGLIQVSDWAKLLRRWSNDYQFLNSNAVSRWIAPRGFDALAERIAAASLPEFAITGSMAAATWAEYAPLRAVAIYTADRASAAKEWGLRATDTGANVLLAEPAYSVVFERTTVREDGLRVAAPAQVAVDLMTGPGRAPAEADHLLEWMQENEDTWR
ncbi:hypothetical protein GCM10022261_02180 [Brevibacterium daeguense]|uniref:HTH iclR-type domain-containing protein n=1 Tax=Brevibacterium daeguense TaxID=909936 RepID=A0ABP8EFE0_9MICO|nr:hypothetical protein [Brevibacterium daeguense]